MTVDSIVRYLQAHYETRHPVAVAIAQVIITDHGGRLPADVTDIPESWVYHAAAGVCDAAARVCVRITAPRAALTNSSCVTCHAMGRP